MYTIREIDVIDGVNSVNHVWFLVKTLEEAEELILKRCFRAFKNPITGEYGQYIEKIKWANGSKDGWTRSCLMLFMMFLNGSRNICCQGSERFILL